MILDLDHTLGCGQVFRWKKERGLWKGVVDGRMAVLRQDGPGVRILSGMDPERFRSYFRLEDDLEGVYAKLGGDPILADYFKRYRGLRLIRQDPWECLASYVLATNANIPRIQGMIERVCRTFGEEMDGFFAFPTPERLLDRCQRAEGCGLGYRAKRFIELAGMAYREEFDLDAFRSMGYEECVRELVKLPGVGPKVADCVLLFSLGHRCAFVRDVWIKRVLSKVYAAPVKAADNERFVRERFGEYGGIVQQYLFHYARSKKVFAKPAARIAK